MEHKRNWLGAGILLGFAAAGMVTAGCDNSCEGVYRCPPPPDLGEAAHVGGSCPDDPAHGDVGEHCGVWVAASWGNDENPGTQAEPVATIARAIAVAQEHRGRIYACTGVYAEVVGLPSGISLGGGFACEDGAWTYEGETANATIAPGFPTVAALMLLEGPGRSTITDLIVQAADSIEPGSSSIAVMALDGAEAILDRCALFAGNGADGADGADGDHNDAPAFSGLPGNPGAHACTETPGLGGVAVKFECDGGVTLGGNGGNGGEGFANDGAPGLQPPDPNPLGYGAGGKAEDLATATLCTGGTAGVHGNSGNHGAGGTDWGRLTVDGYIGAPGDDGFPGTPGQGGGGGGGSVGSVICGAAAPHGGAGGGSGGTGGCGGRAGKGGQGGGSSFGLAVLDARVTLLDVKIYLGNGGNGGDGGALQPGGQGGLPGLGGLGFGGASGVKGGCHGGAGGQGGNGGNGGGGTGGHSLGVVTLSQDSVPAPGPLFLEYGNVGLGGRGGNSSLQGTNGNNGLAGNGITLSP